MNEKNLIIVHLAALSELLLHSFPDKLQTLFSLGEDSISFPRFYSSSTSRIMSLADLFLGTTDSLDRYSTYPDDGIFHVDHTGNLFAILQEHGYCCKTMRYDPYSNIADAWYCGLWPDECDPVDGYTEYDDFLSGVEAAVQKVGESGKPYALHLLNGVADFARAMSISCDNSGADGMMRHCAAGMELLDRFVKVVLEAVRRSGALDKTILVVIGDHGSELWTHGLNGGHMYGLEPYATQCHVPMMIHNGVDKYLSDSLFSMVDLKHVLLHLLFPDTPPVLFGKNLSTGVDILQGARQLAFSQSLPALFRLHGDPALGIVKSYAVTNGSYRLVATVGQSREDEGGMELFCDPLDPDNTSNLLEFMTLDASGRVTNFDCRDAVHPHFIMNMTPTTIQRLVATYQELRKILVAYIREKENNASPVMVGDVKNVFSNKALSRKRQRR